MHTCSETSSTVLQTTGLEFRQVYVHRIVAIAQSLFPAKTPAIAGAYHSICSALIETLAMMEKTAGNLITFAK